MAAAALSGALLFASFPGLDWNSLVWVAAVPLLAALVRETSLWRAFLEGHLCGAVFIAGSCHWFIDVLEIHGGLSPALALLALALFLLVYPLIFGMFGLTEAWAARRSPALALALSPFLWVAMELGRMYWLTGFPWNLLGYAVRASGLRQWASFTAVYGLSFLAMTTSALLAAVLLQPRRRAVRIASVAWLLLLTLGNWLSTPPPARAGSRVAHLVQPNVPLDLEGAMQWAPWRNRAPLDNLVALTTASVQREGNQAAGPPVVIWPEDPAPFYFDRDAVFREAVERMARATRSYVVVGTVTFADAANTQPKNSAVVLDPGGRVVLMYDKMHLVPFGEYVPSWAFPNWVGKITHEAGNFVPGTRHQAAETPEGALSVFICYESIFPGLVRRLTPEGPGVLVNISNDAWFGDSAAASQHFEMARLRAIETGRFLLRATNDGLTATIDPYGRVVDELARQRLGVLTGRFDYLGARTFYMAHGDVFAWLCVVISFLLVVHRGWPWRRGRASLARHHEAETRGKA